MDGMISPERLAQVRRMAIREAASRPPKGEMKGGDGHLEMRVPLAAYINARQNEGVEVLTAAGKGYWDDMKRMYPECRVAYVPGKVRIGGAGSGKRGAGSVERGCWVSGERVLTRVGRASFHKVYG